MAYASRKNIVVELALFCPMYEEKQWALSPMNAKNNLNGFGDIPRTNVYTLDKSGSLLGVQESLTRKLVTELNPFENLFFEIANEPYFGGITMDWQHRITDVIVETEKSLPNKHLIAGGIPPSGSARALVDPEKTIAVYLRSESSTGPWSARWTGFIVPPETGEFQFHTFSNDGIRLWIDTKSGEATAIPPTSGNKIQSFKATAFQTDIALRLLRQSAKCERSRPIPSKQSSRHPPRGVRGEHVG